LPLSRFTLVDIDAVRRQPTRRIAERAPHAPPRRGNDVLAVVKPPKSLHKEEFMCV
jgi:hypothetical protein